MKPAAPSLAPFLHRGMELGFGPLLGQEPLGSGASNDCVLLRFAAKTVVAKRPKGRGDSGLSREALLLGRLPAGMGPALHGTVEGGEGTLAGLLLEWRAGMHRFGLDPREARALGRRLGQLHAQPVEGLSPPLEVVRESPLAPLASRWETVCARIPLEAGHRFSLCLEGLGRLESGVSVPLAASLVHGDLIPLNILFGDDGRCVLLDWERARIDHPIWDVAGVLKSFRFEAGALDAFFLGYGSRPGPELLAWFAGLENLRVALWRLEAFHVRGEYREISERFLGELGEELGRVESILRDFGA